MKHETPNMADTQASNGQLTVKQKVEKDPASSLKNIGTCIHNPLTDKYVGRGHYNKLKRDGIELCQLERNSWINEFDGTLTVEEFLNQPHIQMLTNSKHSPLVEPATGEEYDDQKIAEMQDDMKEGLKSSHLSLAETVIGQAKHIDELNKELNQMHVENRQMLVYLETLQTKTEVLSKTSADLFSEFNKMLDVDWDNQ